MKIRQAEFSTTAVDPSGYPSDGLPEVALVGRSNVGKSSLINTLSGRKALARTSSAPGKTRTINFYKINNAFYLVDLPGYGYASVPLTEREGWKRMVERYFESRPAIKGVVVVLDCRRDPGPVETSLYLWLADLGKPVVTVTTKCDKLSRNRLSSRLALIRKSLPFDDPVEFSAANGRGKASVGAKIAAMVTGTIPLDKDAKGD